jgi:hypothetical protein
MVNDKQHGAHPSQNSLCITSSQLLHASQQQFIKKNEIALQQNGIR